MKSWIKDNPGTFLVYLIPTACFSALLGTALIRYLLLGHV